MISLSRVTKSFGTGDTRTLALDDVSIDVPRGTIFGVVGQSGAGKSTLIRTVNLLERPDSGTVTIDGRDVTALPEAELRDARRGIGMIFQHFNLLSSRTVEGNVSLGLEIAGQNKKTREARTAEILELVGLGEKAKSYPSQLSGGQKQRVGIARALASNPSVLLSDEATSALDPEMVKEVLDTMVSLARDGMTMICITHEMGFARAIADTVVFMDAGQVVMEAPPQHFFGPHADARIRKFVNQML